MARSKKKSKSVIPKRIAGVKVPKKVRKGRFGELLASKTGQALIAQAILGAGAVAAGLKATDEPKLRGAAKRAKARFAGKTDGAGGAASAAVGAALAYAVGEAARTFAEALSRRNAGTPPSAAEEEEAERWTPDYGAPETRTPQ
jgi:hypothetical protein